MFTLIISLLIFGLLYFFVLRKLKLPAFGAVTLITGGVKKGKSALSVRFVRTCYRRVLFKWYIRKFFAKLLHREVPEKPLIYSNIPLRKTKYCQLTDDHLMRRVRFNYGSIVLLDEASLVADSQLIKDKKINTELMLFFKLFGHETKGGCIFVNSHGLTDLHYSIKRTTSTYYYVHALHKYPFVVRFEVREERYSDDGTVQNVYDADVSKSMLNIFGFKSLFKYYDSFCYSVFTDKLPLDNRERYIQSRFKLKSDHIVSFRPELRDLTVHYNIKEAIPPDDPPDCGVDPAYLNNPLENDKHAQT